MHMRIEVETVTIDVVEPTIVVGAVFDLAPLTWAAGKSLRGQGQASRVGRE